MIYLRDDGTYVIERNGVPYHVIEADSLVWADVQERITQGEATEREKPFKPGNAFIFNNETWAWELPISLLKVEKKKEITEERDRRILLGFEFQSKMIQADPGSQAIAHQYLTKLLAGSLVFPLVWRTLDNTYLSIVDATQFTQFTESMTAHVNKHFTDSWTAKDTIDSSTTLDAVDTAFNDYMGGINE